MSGYALNQEVSVRQSDLRHGEWFRCLVTEERTKGGYYIVRPLTGNQHSLFVHERDIKLGTAASTGGEGE